MYNTLLLVDRESSTRTAWHRSFNAKEVAGQNPAMLLLGPVDRRTAANGK